MRAFVDIREQPVYRRAAFVSGLKAAGCDVSTGAPQSSDCPSTETVYVCWNRYGPWHDHALRVERAGGTVIVAENGYLAPGGASPHDMKERETYAIALDHHNGGGRWPNGDGSRWNALGIELQPWRESGSHILICPNRSFGTPGRIMPPDWGERTKAKLQALTGREIRIRSHPGNNAPQKSLAEDLRDCWAVVIWHSSAGVHALISGIPVICCGPSWIAKAAAGNDLAQIESPPMPDRLPAMRRLAHAQYSVSEISTGIAFERLLEREPIAA